MKKTKEKNKRGKKFEFSKLIIFFETVLVGWVTWEVIELMRLCVISNYLGSLTVLATLITVVYAAYGTSVAFYYNKAKLENQLKLERVMKKEALDFQKTENALNRINIETYTNSNVTSANGDYTSNCYVSDMQNTINDGVLRDL